MLQLLLLMDVKTVYGINMSSIKLQLVWGFVLGLCIYHTSIVNAYICIELSIKIVHVVFWKAQCS